MTKVTHLTQPHSTQPNLTQPDHDHRPIHVLVVHDQLEILDSIRTLLAAEPAITVHTCTDATLALSVATKVSPSVILQALAMPGVDGTLLINFFRSHPKTRQVPIVILSSQEDSNTRAMAFTAGANDYLIKLPDPIELIARLRYHSIAYHNALSQSQTPVVVTEQISSLHKAPNVKAPDAQTEAHTAELKAALDTLQQTQAKLIHTQKANSIGQLAAGITQRVNTPMSFIYGNLNSIEGYIQDLLALVTAYHNEYPSPTPGIQEKLEEIDLDFSAAGLRQSFISLRSGAKQIRNLALNLQQFSQLDNADITPVNLHEGIDSTLAMMAADLEDITIEKNYSDLPLVACSASQLNQVFMHIVRNAADAIKSAQSSPAIITLSTTAVDDARIVIEIEDSGPGIPSDIQAYIFDPFFTTKDIGQGTGLGLSISEQIVAVQHNGKLTVSSVPGESTKFSIELPVR